MMTGMKKICCFGEILMRVSPPQDWIAAHQLQVYIGGAEANVATALANWDMPVQYCTAMPDNYIGRDIEEGLRQRRIDTSAIAWQGNRVGLYYMQQGADLKHSGVIYDRAHSSFYDLKPGDIDWNSALEDVGWFHFTAISPALNENVAAVCQEALQAAQQRGIIISADLNYRAKLWKYGKNPMEVMPTLIKYCDVIMGNIWAANTLLGIALDPGVETTHQKEAYLQHAVTTSEALMQQFPRCKTLAYTFRFDEAPAGISYYAALYRDNTLQVSKHFEAKQIKDKAGSGDCFMAGLIYGIQQEHSAQQIIDFAAAAAFGKLQETGDASRQSIADVQNILAQHD